MEGTGAVAELPAMDKNPRTVEAEATEEAVPGMNMGTRVELLGATPLTMTKIEASHAVTKAVVNTASRGMASRVMASKSMASRGMDSRGTASNKAMAATLDATTTTEVDMEMEAVEVNTRISMEVETGTAGVTAEEDATRWGSKATRHWNVREKMSWTRKFESIDPFVGQEKFEAPVIILE